MMAEDLPVFDPEPLTVAFGEFGDGALDTLALFPGAIRPLIEIMQRALAEGDLHAAGEAAHSTKGAANVSGALRLGACSAAIERAALHERDLTAARAAATQVVAAFEEVLQVIGRLRGPAG